MKPESLRARLLALMLCLSVVPIALVAFLVYRAGEQTLSAQFELHLGALAELKSQQIDLWLRERRNDVRRPVAMRPFQAYVAALSRRDADALRSTRGMLERIRASGEFAEVFLVDARTGEVLLSTDAEQEGKFKTDRPYFREGRQAEFVQHVYYSLALGQAVMTVSAPVSDPGGQPLAILVGRIDLRFLDRLMAERAGLGATGRTFLVNRFNYFVSASMGLGAHGWPRYVNHESRKVMGAYRWLPDLGLALVAEVDEDEAFAAIRYLRIAMVPITAIVSLVALLVSSAVLTGVWRALTRLVEATRRIGRGELDYRVQVRRPEELRALASAINSMAEDLLRSRQALDAHREELERRVEEHERQAEAHRRATEALAAVGRLISHALGPEEIGRRIVDSVRALFRARMAVLYRLEPESQDLVMLAGVGDGVDWNSRLGKGTATVGVAVKSRQPITTPDLLTDPRIELAPEARVRLERSGYSAVLATPLILQDTVIGGLAIGDSAGRAFDDEELQLAQAFADQAAIALETSRLSAEAERRRQETEEFARVGRELTGALDVPAVGARIVDGILPIFRAESADLRLLDPDRTLVEVASAGPLRTAFPPGHRVPRGAGISALAIADARPVWTPDILGDPRIVLSDELRHRIGSHGPRAVLAAPLRAHDRIIGVLSVGAALGRGYTEGEIALLETFADLAALALERARLYEEARRARDFLQSIAENSADTICTTDVRGRLTYVSPGVEEIFGHAPAELLGRRVGELCRGGWAEARSITSRLNQASRIRDYETGLRTRRGDWVEVNASISLLRDSAGAVVGTLSVIRDVTAHKRLEDAQRESERRYRMLAENVSDVVWLADRGLRLTYVSPSIATLYGYTATELEGDPLATLLTRASVDHARSLLAEADADPGAGHAPAVMTLELELRHKAGSTVWTETRMSLLRDEGGGAIGVLGVTRDISSRKQAEAALRQREAELRQAQKMEAVGRLAGGVAHDFNNLLTVIIGRTELLGRRVAEETAKRDIALIARTAKRAAALTKQLLAFSRKQVLAPKAASLTDLVTDLLPMLRRLLGEDVEIVTELAPSLAAAMVDPGQVEQIVTNLVVNARDAMPTGGRLTLRTADVELTEDFVRRHPGSARGPHVMLAVSDTGIGMTADVLAHLFEPFFTTKPPGEGTGLGLSTVYGIVKQHEGYIGVESAPGRGATFTVYFPRIEAEAERSSRADAPSTTTVSRDGRTIVLVEDEDQVRELISEMLASAGYRVLQAPGAEEALRVVARYEGDIHLLFTDVVMPGISGPELAERALAARPGIRVLYMSGYTDDRLLRHGVLRRGLNLLHKPFTPDELLGTVREALDGG